MKVAVVFDTPYRGWTSNDYLEQMNEEMAALGELEPEQEYQVAHSLIENGHDVVFVGVRDDLGDFVETLEREKVDLVFNLTEAFRDIDTLDYLVPAILDAEGYLYTGASPQSLMVTRNKAISKKILAHHGLRVPRFITYRMGDTPKEPPELDYPAIVKPLQLDASTGISKASVVKDFDGLVARVKFIHEKVSGAAIVEEFIEGRELYAAIVGNGDKLEMLPLSELVFDKNTKNEERIATKAAKWDEPYRERMGIKNVIARPVSKLATEQDRARIQGGVSKSLATRLRPTGPSADSQRRGVGARGQRQSVLVPGPRDRQVGRESWLAASRAHRTHRQSGAQAAP